METQTRTKLNTPAIDEETSRVISAIRIILALMILLCHCMVFVEDRHGIPAIFQKFFLTGTLTSSALPLFFIISGYLHFSKPFDYAPMVAKKIKSLAIPYFIICFATSLFFQAKSMILHSGTASVFLPWIFDFPCEKLFSFPTSLQLWYLRILLLMFVLSPVLKIVIEKFPVLYFSAAYLTVNSGVNLFGLPIPTYYELGSGLLYFGLGAFFAMKKLSVQTISSLKLKDLASVFILVSLVHLATLVSGDAIILGMNSAQLAPHVNFASILVSSLLLIKIVSNAVKNDRIFAVMKNLSEYSMWIYLIHAPIPQWIADNIILPRIPAGNDFLLIAFILFKFVSISALCLLSGIVLRKICPPLFALISGGRAKKKIQQKAG